MHRLPAISPSEGTRPRRGGRPLAGLIALASITACIALQGSVAQAATCPNEALRVAQGATSLPGCMALEMVSPPKKFGQTAYKPSFSASGERLRYFAQAALADTPGFQFFAGDIYVASRTASGWQSAPTSPPAAEEIIFGGRFGANPSAFSPELERWVQLGATQSQAQVGLMHVFSGGLDGSFAPLSPLLVPISNGGGNQIQFSASLTEVSGAAASLATTVFQGNSELISYLPGDPQMADTEPGGDGNSYLAFLDEGQPAVELLARDKEDTVWGGRCGAHLGGLSTAVNQSAISPDGTRIYISTRPAQPFDSEKAEGPKCDTDNPLRIMRRTATEAGPVIEPLLGGEASELEEPGDDAFEGASADGGKVYLTTTRELAASDTDSSATECSFNFGASEGCDLYLYDTDKPEGERLTHVSAGEDANPADVLTTITAISRDGAHAYYVAQGALTNDPNPEGAVAQAGQPNLYAYEAQSGETAFIATLSPEDKEGKGGMWGAGGSFFSDAYAAGDVLAFASKAPLTAGDEDGGHRDVFRYDAAGETLQRVSVAAEGGSDDGPFHVTVSPNGGKEIETNFGEQSRWVAEDGEAIAFATEEALLPGDEDGAANPYLWTNGELGAAQAPVTIPPAISPQGEEIAFSTSAALLPQDGDSAEDVYLAREGGGFPFPVAPTRCDPLQEGSCQEAVIVPMAPGAPATGSFSGPGNVKAPTHCRKPLVKRRGRCVRKARKGKARKRSAERRGGKR